MSCKKRKNRKVKAAFFAGCVSSSVVAHADAVGIVGGSTGVSGALPYVVLLTDFEGATLTVPGLPNTGVSQIDAVDINLSGLSLIGGRNDSEAYAAFVQSNGSLIPLTLGIPTGEVFDVAINTSGAGLLGVHNFGSISYFATFVAADGTVNPVDIPATLYAVDLSDNGVGLVGGEGNGSAGPYAAFVSNGGMVAEVPLIMGAGRINNVAINASGNGIVSGYTSDVYAAFIYADTSSLQLVSLPSGSTIASVAINNSGVGLVGGFDGSSNAYAGSVALDGTVTSLFSSPFNGAIRSVALNDTGVGLIGGQDGGNFYAAFAQPNQPLFPLFTSPQAGTINSVAINAQGVGLLGGQLSGSEAYAALVAPNGTLTPLNLAGYSVGSVALANGEEILNQVVPTTVGPYSSIFYSQLAAMKALNNRFCQQNRVWVKQGVSSNPDVTQGGIDAESLEANLAFSPKVRAMPKESCASLKPNSFWFEPFGDFLFLDGEGTIPKYQNKVGGALLGYDRQGSNYIVGASAGYVFNYVAISQNVGHAKVQEELGSIYGSWYSDHFWMALAFSGGPYQVTNIRHFLGSFTAKGKYHGWIFDPHLEIASPWALDSCQLYYVEPFARFDWINNWQHHYTETGTTGFNLQVPSTYNSLLQSEAGLRFYQQFLYGWGKLCLEEKVSYINQAPFDVKQGSVSFVGSASAFPVAQFSSKTQNLGSGELLVCFVPQNPTTPYGGFSFEGTAGSSYQSYFASLFLGVDF